MRCDAIADGRQAPPEALPPSTSPAPGPRNDYLSARTQAPRSVDSACTSQRCKSQNPPSAAAVTTSAATVTGSHRAPQYRDQAGYIQRAPLATRHRHGHSRPRDARHGRRRPLSSRPFRSSLGPHWSRRVPAAGGPSGRGGARSGPSGTGQGLTAAHGRLRGSDSDPWGPEETAAATGCHKRVCARHPDM